MGGVSLRKLIWKLRRILRTPSCSPALLVPLSRAWWLLGQRRALWRMQYFRGGTFAKSLH